MDKNRTEYLIAKHLSGEATSKEESDLRSWLNSDIKNKEEFDEIALIYQLSNSHSDSSHKSIVLDKIKDKISKERRVSTNRRRPIYFWLVAAASTIVFITFSLLFYSTEDTGHQLKPEVKIVKKSNPAGQKSKIFLPDGSIAWLNSESSLSYEADFNDSIRLIEMEGEAYFEVKKDASRPFVVKSKSITTTALGTAFNINTFKGEQEVHVALTEGVVSVENTLDANTSKITINQGEGIVYDPAKSNDFEKVMIDIKSVRQWKDGILILNANSFEETINLLSRWYGVEFHISNKPIRAWNVTGVFDNEHLENVMSTLSFSQDFNFEIKGKQVYVTFK